MVARDVPLAARTTAVGRGADALQHARPALAGHRAAVDYRTRSLAGRWSAWRTADADTGPDAALGRAAAPGWHDGNLDWAGASRGVQFRHVGSVTRLRAYYLWSKPKALQPARTPQLAGCRRSSPARAGRPTRRSRARSRSTRRRSSSRVVHHTAGTNTYTPAQAAAIVRGIEVYHVKGNGWNDIGYNFLVDRFGTVYEGRGGRHRRAT